ncbi:ATP-binding protein [Niallia sp. 01092]|uniref:ATP-binding protein n=1 Tax=unclassified Niallia TaxID=2837522 RepID=UPI003FD2AB61
MNLLTKAIEKLPFPYFLINHKLEIISTSIPHSSYLTSTFADYIHSNIDDFYCFLESDINEMELAVHLPILQNESFYRIYKVREDQLFHLFCFPLKKQDQHVERLSDQIKNQLFEFHQHMNEQKVFFDHTMHTFKELALSNDYSKNIGKLAAGIAHEIRNPLTTVKGFIQLIKPHLEEIKKERYAEIALEEIDRANDIIFDFLNASKPKENNWNFLSINTLIRDICTLFESESIMKNITMKLELTDHAPFIYFNEKQLKQVLVNIIKNAFEAIEESANKHTGIILIRTSLNESNVFITIEDNGCGISDDGVKKLFNPFYTTKGEGTGIGLSVCKKIVEDYGGKLYAKSEGTIGTTFYVELPLSIKF